MKKLRKLTIALMLLVGVMCFSACDFNTEKTLTYEIVNDSMAPALEIGDKVKVKAKEVYEVGDIIAHTHRDRVYITRIIYIFKAGSINFYICKGDNIQNLDGTDANGEWSDDAAYIQDLVDSGVSRTQFLDDYSWAISNVNIKEIKGYVFETIKSETE